MIIENIHKIKERISAICLKTKHDSAQITIVAVSKGRAIGQIQEAIEAGITDIAENKVQEAILKYKNLTPNTFNLKPVRWHMVGHLQTNKVKEAVRIFDLIQSVDTLRLAAEINRQAVRMNKVQDILVEINTSLEPSKFGLKPDTAVEVIEEIANLRNIRIKGLMTIAPIVDNPEKARPYFRMLKDLRDKVNAFFLSTGYPQLATLSMGMTDDFEVAVEEGSNMVRIGRAIFES